MEVCNAIRSVRDRSGWSELSSGQWRAMRDGNAGEYGIDGNVVSVSYRL
jgi:hypothetical protein